MPKSLSYVIDKYLNLMDWIGKNPAKSFWAWLVLIALALSV